MELRPASPVFPASSTPSDAESAVGMKARASPQRLQLTVEKRVPLVGWLGLGLAKPKPKPNPKPKPKPNPNPKPNPSPVSTI